MMWSREMNEENKQTKTMEHTIKKVEMVFEVCAELKILRFHVELERSSCFFFNWNVKNVMNMANRVL